MLLGPFYISKVMRTKLISKHHNHPLASHFRIDKTRELIAQKYNLRTFCHNVETYVIGSDVGFASKIVRHKLYSDLQLLSVSTD